MTPNMGTNLIAKLAKIPYFAGGWIIYMIGRKKWKGK